MCGGRGEVINVPKKFRQSDQVVYEIHRTTQASKIRNIAYLSLFPITASKIRSL